MKNFRSDFQQQYEYFVEEISKREICFNINYMKKKTKKKNATVTLDGGIQHLFWFKNLSEKNN